MGKTLHITFLLCGILASFQVLAQQVYTSAHYGSPGTQQLYSSHFDGYDESLIIQGGEDITWDVSGLAASGLSYSDIVTRDQGLDIVTFTTACALSGINVFACLGIWNNTQQVWQQQDTQFLIFFPVTDVQRFQRKTATQLLETFFGFTLDFGGAPTPFAVVYQSPDTVLTFPVSFGTSHTSRISWGLNLQPAGFDIQYQSNQTRTSTADAWGTVITPFDTLREVIRVRAVVDRNDVLTTDSISLPILVSQVEYTWFDTSYGLPVMIATGILTDTSEVINNVSFVVNAVCADHQWSVSTDPTVYYLDSIGVADVVFDLLLPNANTYAWDFGDGNTSDALNSVTHTYTSGGIYTVSVTGCMTDCLPWNSCVTQTLTIEVRDTTSSVQLPEPAAHGIRIFPNPVRDRFSIEVPGGAGTLTYLLMDVYGRPVRTGILQPGSISEITTAQLPDGMYVLRLQDMSGGSIFSGTRILVSHHR